MGRVGPRVTTNLLEVDRLDRPCIEIELLEPDGAMLLQAITIQDQVYEQALKSVDFIQSPCSRQTTLRPPTRSPYKEKLLENEFATKKGTPASASARPPRRRRGAIRGAGLSLPA